MPKGNRSNFKNYRINKGSFCININKPKKYLCSYTPVVAGLKSNRKKKDSIYNRRQ